MSPGESPRARQHAPGERAVEDDLIYDVGAHLGDDTEFYLRLGYRVVAVEANPELAARLRERFAEALSRGRLTVVECAVARSLGTVEFFANIKSPEIGTANPDWAARTARTGHPSRSIVVAAVPFGAILHEHGIPHYLKVDIEGSDQLCIAALRDFAARPRFVSIEASVGSWRELVNEFDVLESLGYKRFQIVRQDSHPARTLVSLGGGPVTFSFKGFTSGPFGEHLRGSWLSRRQALWRYWWLYLLERYFGLEAPIGRILARIPILRRIPSSVSWYDTHAAR